MEKTVSVAQAVTGSEAVLPARVQEALGELVGAAREGLLALSVGVGLGVLAELMEEEVVEVVGPKGRQNPDRVAVRHGHESGEVTRLSFHPGQYTVLNSETAAVVDNAVADLEVQAALLDGLGLGAEAVVVLHVGGAAGGRRAGADRFEAGSIVSPSERGPASCSRTTIGSTGSPMFFSSPSGSAFRWCGTSYTTTATTPKGFRIAKRSSVRSPRGGRESRRRFSTLRRGSMSASAATK